MSHTPRGEQVPFHTLRLTLCVGLMFSRQRSRPFSLCFFFLINVSDMCLRMHPSRNVAPQIQNFFWFRMPSPVPLDDLMKSSSFDPGLRVLASPCGHPKSQSQRVVPSIFGQLGTQHICHQLGHVGTNCFRLSTKPLWQREVNLWIL